jgi:hypothetical protein
MDFVCEAFDQMQRAFDLNGFNDHQLHCVPHFDSGATPDAAILRRATIASIERFPSSPHAMPMARNRAG